MKNSTPRIRPSRKTRSRSVPQNKLLSPLCCTMHDTLKGVACLKRTSAKTALLVQVNDSHHCYRNRRFPARKEHFHRPSMSHSRAYRHPYLTIRCTKPLRTCRSSRDVDQGRTHYRHPNPRTDQSCDRFFFQHITGLQGKEGNGNCALHWHIVIVEWLGHLLATPRIVHAPRAEIVDLHDNGVSKWACVRGSVRVIVRRDLEAASASATGGPVGTECKLIYRSGVPIHFLAASWRTT